MHVSETCQNKTHKTPVHLRCTCFTLLSSSRYSLEAQTKFCIVHNYAREVKCISCGLKVNAIFSRLSIGTQKIQLNLSAREAQLRHILDTQTRKDALNS